MRFIHTADWHIGRASGAFGPEVAKALLEARFAAIGKLEKLAAGEQPDFILMAGDLFEDHSIDRTLVERLGDILGTWPWPVYFISGNHDPIGPGTLWDHPALKRDHLFILRDRQPVDLPGGGLLFPCPLTTKTSTVSPIRHLLEEPFLSLGQDKIRIGLAHGDGTDSQLKKNNDHPVNFKQAAEAGLDYLALGHWHGQYLALVPSGRGSAAYSGAIEPGRFNKEIDAGMALLVSIESPGTTPILKPLKTLQISWQSEVCLIDSAESVELLINRLRQEKSPEKTMKRLLLTGRLSAEDVQLLDELQGLMPRFLHGEILDDGLHILADEAWLAGLPSGPLAAAAKNLAQNADNDPVRREALAEFQMLWRASNEI